jgi:hypothetical protein
MRAHLSGPRCVHLSGPVRTLLRTFAHVSQDLCTCFMGTYNEICNENADENSKKTRANDALFARVFSLRFLRRCRSRLKQDCIRRKQSESCIQGEAMKANSFIGLAWEGRKSKYDSNNIAQRGPRHAV